MDNIVAENSSRRSFFHMASAAAFAGLGLSDGSLLAPAAEPGGGSTGGASFQAFAAQELQSDIDALKASPGNKSLIRGKNFTLILICESASSGKEFEWHEGRDHIFQIIDGATEFELGGAPNSARKVQPGEWLAPESVGAVRLMLEKGDLLVIPRGTPHRRSTAKSATLLLISPQGTANG